MVIERWLALKGSIYLYNEGFEPKSTKYNVFGFQKIKFCSTCLEFRRKNNLL